MTNMNTFFKLIIFTPLVAVAACSTNQATGRNQFTGLMPASQEAAIGAQEHQKVLAEFGGEMKNSQIQSYVRQVGQKIVPFTERQDVNYTFTVLDTPVINAFALPGGYVYVTRGILALANSESELAGVIGHEIGHVTARHSAERYSTSVVTGLGASILAAAVNVNGASEVLGVGANLYLSSYSRSQEHEADNLGVRYLSRAGYDTMGMANFLSSLEASAALESKERGEPETTGANSYFSTHPVTAQRVAQSTAEAQKYPNTNANQNRIEYLRMINGLEVGDSSEQGFVDNGFFVHPQLGFKFAIPSGYKTTNTPSAFVAQGSNGALVFTAGRKQSGQSIADYLRNNVLQGNTSNARDFGTNTINGMNTASVEQTGVVNGRQSNVRFVVFEWDSTTVYQFALAMPTNISNAEVQAMQQAAFSFERLSNSQKNNYRPKSLTLRVAKAGDTVQSMSADFPYNDNLNAERFRVFNGMSAGEQVVPQQAYKVITQ